ncbi:DUF885 domain-containing protein [Duganella sp. BJB488]|uniref:DUF885 domain-containing protein n=1 Tax=unclassified Duganella TaxID=2636909 RepID=UPI000E35266B|nr:MULTISPECIES: DUF885 domain-containing protein [unclassified Duganella]RFP24095.1 DUF885 domain-containing protein [Duganella sp. BJB489]RFP26457.1 DUF885 domain-containing protein [Duganella sp. BJB488]RFP34812.1 DUF885 domain-containing protein [Duganella sp. BJB480]
MTYRRNTLATLAPLAAAVMLAFAPLASSAAAPAIAVPQVSAAPAHKALRALADQYYDASARFEPLNATENGDNRFDDQLGLSIAPAKRAQQFKLYRQFAARLKTIKRAQLDNGDRINYDILGYELNQLLAMEKFPEHLLPINQMDSVPVTLANYAGGEASQPIGTVKEYDAYLNRISQLPAWIDQAIANMREGMKQGITEPKAIMESGLPQFQKLVSATPESNIFSTPITKLPAAFDDADKQRLTAAYRKTVGEQLMPALARLATFLEKEYVPACRTTTGLGALPNGAAWYQARVAGATTTSLKPDEIHAIGLREVARIQAQFEVLGPKLGYTGPASGLPVWVAAQPKFYPFKTEDEVQAVYRKLNDVLDTKLPLMFTLLPKAKLDLRLEPELSRATASDHYTAPAGDGSRPGVFWSVVNDPGKYGSTGMTTLFLHEGKPGHHFHIALMQELNLPNFRKYGGNNAFTEGWALYAETLGKEMGLFDDPAQYFGHLNDELLRATRLVVDTGMHAQGWTREQSIQYMHDTLGYDNSAKTETERYMAWPGQALGYKIGSLKIVELRQRAAKALGDKFSLPKFHAVVLGDGTLPLALLEEKVDRWIAAQK